MYMSVSAASSVEKMQITCQIADHGINFRNIVSVRFYSGKLLI